MWFDGLLNVAPPLLEQVHLILVLLDPLLEDLHLALDVCQFQMLVQHAPRQRCDRPLLRLHLQSLLVAHARTSNDRVESRVLDLRPHIRLHRRRHGSGTDAADALFV